MSQVAVRQLKLITALAGGHVAPHALPPQRPTVPARLMQLGSSISGYLGSFVWPSMAIVGRELAWGGSGNVTLVPKLPARDFFREIVHGRPVIFIRRADADPYSAITNLLRFDQAQNLNTVLNGNSWVAIAGVRDGKKVFTHVGNGREGKVALARHQMGLTTARSALNETCLLPRIATPICVHRDSGFTVLTQSYLEGTKIDLPKLSNDDFCQRLTSASDSLVRIHENTFRREFPEQDLIGHMKLDATHVPLSPGLRSGLMRIIMETESWLETRQPGCVQVHGDYTLSNVLFDAQGDVSAILDWEWARKDGVAGFDAVYLGIAAGASRLGTDLPTLAVDIVNSKGMPDWLVRYFDSSLNRLGMDAPDLVPLTKLVWLATVFRSGVWTRPTYDDWLEKVVTPMVQSLKDTQ